MTNTQLAQILKKTIKGEFDKCFKEQNKEIDKRFEKVDQQFRKVDLRFEKVDQQFRGVRKDIRKLNSNISIVIELFDKDILKNSKRLDKIEDHLNLQRSPADF